MNAQLAPHLVETHLITVDEAREMYAEHVCDWNASSVFALPSGAAVAQSAALGHCWRMLTDYEERNRFRYNQ
eukprot:3064972-Prymnesium_polylepis.1